MIAALFVETGGSYFGLPNVDPWDEARDARLYDCPYPVVAHPPCARWGRYWAGGPSARVRRKLGDDDGCFASAFDYIRKWGGVIEHPEGSTAWKAFGIPCPPKSGGWISLLDGGYTCCVEQGHYGHRARKATWLYTYGCELPRFTWGPSEAKIRLDQTLIVDRIRTVAVKLGSLDTLFLRAMEYDNADDIYAAIQEFVADSSKELHELSRHSDAVLNTLIYGKGRKR
jgi:hypothetical protein